MTDRYAVIGNPIKHSKSPAIHRAFAQQTGQDIQYSKLLGGLENFANDVKVFRDSGGKGMNITVPFKEQAYQLADVLSPRAQAAGSVNTLTFTADTIQGDNTDGAGLVRDLSCNHRFGFTGSRILLLGAGGASRGVLQPLLETNPANIVIANRTASKALDLAGMGGSNKVQGCGLDQLADQQFDLVVNATAAGLQDEVPSIPDDCLATNGWVYDMMYGMEPTAFVRWGQRHGASKALDGLGMLVEQGAESFRLWRRVTPDTTSVIQQLR